MAMESSFSSNDIESAEQEEIINWVIDTHSRWLGPELEARRIIDEFRLELERTRQAFRGVEQRRCSLEKTSQVVEERLLDALYGVRENTREFVHFLMYGDQVLGQEDPADPEGTLSLVSPPVVQNGAQLLAQVDAVRIFVNDLVWQFDDFQRWRRLYQDAAEEGEALLVGVC